jgi:L-phenylalanine/L-methionine N-acetyltransferase
MLANQVKPITSIISQPFLSPSAPTYEQGEAIVRVRHAKPEDCETLHQLFAEPEIMYWTVELPFTSERQLYQRIAHQPEGHYTLVACAGYNVIGSLDLVISSNLRMRHVARISSVAVHPSYQGKGVGSALVKAALNLADNWLNLHRLELVVYTDNEAAIALYRKFGFVVEGRLSQMAFRAGRYVDVHIMGRLTPTRQ